MKRLLLIFATLLAILLCGCQEEILQPFSTVTTAPSQATVPTQDTTVPPGFAYTEAEIVFTEPYGSAYGVTGVQTSYHGITYGFRKEIFEAKREALIYQADAILSCLGSEFSVDVTQYSIWVRKDDYPVRVEGNNLYIGIDNIFDEEAVTGFAQLVLGREVNYGVLYAYAHSLLEGLGYAVDTPACTLEEALSLCDTAPEYLDLSYPCFIEPYADEATQERVHTLALAFYGSLTDAEKRELLTAYTDESYCTYLSSFLQQNGKSAYDNSDLGGTYFYNGGEYVPLVWENDYASFYLKTDYAPSGNGAYFPENWLTSSYANLRRWAEENILQTQAMEEAFGRFDTAPEEKVPVIFTKQRYGASGFYYPDGHIELFHDTVFMHEYAHYLLRNAPMEGWIDEGICQYYNYRPSAPEIYYGWYWDVMSFQELDPNKPSDKEWQDIIDLTNAHISHAFDWNSLEDWIYFWNANIIYKGWLAKYDMVETKLNSNVYMMRACFLHYLVGIYGEEVTIDAAVYNTPEETFGKTWDALLDEWEHYLLKTFNWAVNAP